MLNFYWKSMLCLRPFTQKSTFFFTYDSKNLFNILIYSQESCPFPSAQFTVIYLHALREILSSIKIVHKNTK